VVNLSRPKAVAMEESKPARDHLNQLDQLGALADFDDGNPTAFLDLAEAMLSTGADGDRDPHREPTQTEAVIEAFGPQLAPVERRQLAFAVDNQLPVSITYRSATGGTTTRKISDLELVNGLLYAWCHLRDDDRVFAIDRVQAVAPVSH
jgi:predicted DNA-binding transcriptional regulator YafY